MIHVLSTWETYEQARRALVQSVRSARSAATFGMERDGDVWHVYVDRPRVRWWKRSATR